MSNRVTKSNGSSNEEDGIQLNSLFRLPQEIVEDILQRLPPKNLIKFSCLSKQCKSVIFNPKFVLHYKALLSSSHLRGLFFPFIPFTRSNLPSKFAMKCRKLELPHVAKLDGLIFYFNSDFSRSTDRIEFDHTLIASSNGLVLSLFRPVKNSLECFVTNPFTNQSVPLPPLLCYNSLRQSSFATRQTEINGSYHVSYRVVLFTSERSSTSCTVHIFSSDTGRWTSPVSSLSRLLTNSSKGQDFCHKGILYWFEPKSKSIATYDPYDAPDRFGSIQLPNVGSDDAETHKGISLVHLGREDSVRYCEIKKQEEVSTLLVWRLVEGEWFLQRRCPISPLCPVESWFSCRQLVCVDSSKSKLVSYMYARRSGHFSVVDLHTGKAKFMEISGEFQGSGCPCCGERRSFVPVVFCPWSSPFYRHHN